MDKLLNNKYRLERKLAEGGMSTVFLCRNIELGNRWVAKFIDDKYIGLVYEEEILKKLNHTNLPRIVDVCKADGGTYIIESFIEGLSLKEKLELLGRFTEEQVIHYGLQLCEVLNYLHEMKPCAIIHKDLKPSNIIVTDYDNLLLIDFGISVQQDFLLGFPGGTMAYCAPEQLSSNVACDSRTDIYSLGILLYEMLTGERPGNCSIELGKNKDTVFNRLICICTGCTRFKPEDRYQTVQEVKAELMNCRNKYISRKENGKEKRKKVLLTIGLLSLINYICLMLGLLYNR